MSKKAALQKRLEFLVIPLSYMERVVGRPMVEAEIHVCVTVWCC